MDSVYICMLVCLFGNMLLGMAIILWDPALASRRHPTWMFRNQPVSAATMDLTMSRLSIRGEWQNRLITQSIDFNWLFNWNRSNHLLNRLILPMRSFWSLHFLETSGFSSQNFMECWVFRFVQGFFYFVDPKRPIQVQPQCGQVWWVP